MSVNELVRQAFLKKGIYWYIAPYYNQAKKIVWQDPEMLPKYVPPEVWSRRNNSELYIPFPNGSILYVMGADKPDSLRGPNPVGIILDEYRDIKAEIWQAIIQPIVISNPLSWCWFVGSAGGSEFKSKYLYAKNGGDINWFSSLMKASQSGLIPDGQLEEAKKTTTQAFYNQEYECEWIEGASTVFRRIHDNLWSGDLFPILGRFYQIGADLAKFQDWTVITPTDRHNLRVGQQDRFNQVEWYVQKPRIEAFVRRYNNGHLIIDSTGAGEPIFEDLGRLGLDVEGINFATGQHDNRLRRQLLDNLAIMLEQDKIKIPNSEVLIDELQNFIYILGDRGKVRMEVPEGSHDDCVMSLALSVWGLTNKLPEPGIRPDSEFSRQNLNETRSRFHYDY